MDRQKKGGEGSASAPDPAAPYEVGYCRPPVEHQFKKGAPSPNAKGRPKKSQTIDYRKLLTELIEVTQGGIKKLMDPLEVELLSLVKLARSGSIRAAGDFVDHCERAGIIEIVEEEDDHQYLLTIPWDWDHDEWMAMYKKHGPPPWKGDRDGLVPPERREAIRVHRGK